jgi:multidrug efflux pump subunit AcrB
VPLAALADVALVPELSGITRRDGERTNTVQAFLVPYALIADSLVDLRARLDASDFTLPAGYRIEFGGEDEQRSEAIGKLVSFAVPLLVVMAGTIVLAFNSFRFAGLIFVVAFLSIGLAQLGVWLFGYPMGFVAIIGTMGLVGLAINDAIVVLTALRADKRSCEADVEQTAAVVLDATRHVLATTFTTIGGFLPLILFGGRFWPPMATAIAGGVAGASILALYLVPAVFIAMQRRDLARERLAGEAVGSPATAHGMRAQRGGFVT